jgi:5-formyltetrahydrofolate cyclo-ligase
VILPQRDVVTEGTGVVSELYEGRVPVEKAAARAELLAARRALRAEVRAAAATRVGEIAVAVLAELAPRTVAGYVPFGTEPGGADLPAALARALPAGGRLLLPVLREDRTLDWATYGAGGRIDWQAPAGTRLGSAAIGQAELVVVPALAVDRHGVRLGRGGGSYDRALALASPNALVVALLYDGELLDALPAEPHDRRVSAAITPSLGLVRLPAPAQ